MGYAAHHLREKQREAERRYREKDPARYRELARAASRRARARRSPAKQAEYRAKQKAADAAWRATPEGARQNRAKRVRAVYGISLEEWEIIVSRGCAICGRGRSDATICVDHDHSSGTIRGALCDRCNWGVGLFGGDDPDRLIAAATYIRGHQ